MRCHAAREPGKALGVVFGHLGDLQADVPPRCELIECFPAGRKLELRTDDLVTGFPWVPREQGADRGRGASGQFDLAGARPEHGRQFAPNPLPSFTDTLPPKFSGAAGSQVFLGAARQRIGVDSRHRAHTRRVEIGELVDNRKDAPGELYF